MNHLELDLTVSFARQQIAGTVIHHLDEADAGRDLGLDTRTLELRGARVRIGNAWREATFRTGPEDPVHGARLTIEVPSGADRVAIEYATHPEASGLGWLEPTQTAGGTHPFLYTQGQCDHTRSWIPCQDEPSLRLTYDARIRVEEDLTVVMAAEPLDRDADGAFRFRMPEPIPSYLIALAVGNLVHRDLGPRSGVWTEPEVLDAAAWEFAGTEDLITTTEALFGPYRWGRYDLLVLPPGFPLGGMENPRLTFATPTVLAGDRSLVSLVAHELAHSWSGNLVTNATWDDFWLNEGFTVYLERRILEAVYGRERSEMEAVLGRASLERWFEELPERDTWLKLDLDGRAPDDVMNDVPYEKGYLLLRHLEETFGRRRFDRFLRSWFDDHAFEARTTADLEDALERRLFPQAPDLAEALDLDAWIRGPGLPPDAPRAESERLERAGRLARDVNGSDLPPHPEWVTHEWLRFLHSLPEVMTPDQLAALDAAYGFTASTNAEIQCAWMTRALHHGYGAVDDALERFLTTVGRRKFLKPLYEELAQTDRGRERALRIYEAARAGYHPTARRQVEGILGIDA